LSKDESCELRKKDFFAMENNCEDDNFWRTEQALFMNEIYATFEKVTVCTQKVLDLGYMRSKTYFNEALVVYEKLGLLPLSLIQEPYSVHFVR
jgi:hypothetical protein